MNEEIAEQYIKKAVKAIDENNIDDAEVTLIEARFKCNTERVASLLKEVQEKKALLNIKMNKNTRNVTKDNSESHETKSLKEALTVRGTRADVKACIEKARVAFDANELEKAKKWLDKSRELLEKVLAAIAARDAPKEVPNVDPEVNPDTVADPNSTVEHNPEDMSDQTNSESTPISTSVPDNIIGASKFLENAVKAYNAGDFKKCEHYLSKAQRMDPSMNLEIYFKKVKDAIDNLNDTSRENAVAENATGEPERYEQTNNLNKDEADTFIQIAINAVHNRNYDRALIFLDKAETVYPSDYAKDVRKSVLDAKDKQKLYANTCRRDVASDEVKESHKYDINKLQRAIRNDIDTGNLEEAVKKLQSPGFVKCVQLNKLRDVVNNLLTLKEQQQPRPTKMVPPADKTLNILNKDEADTYIQVAINAFKDKNYERALIFLDKAESVYPSDYAKDVRKSVLDNKAKQKFFASTCRRDVASDEVKESYKNEINKLQRAIRNDIDAGNLEEAVKKLQFPGFVKCVQLNKLRDEVNNLLTLKEQQQQTPTKIVPPVDKTLNAIHKEEADTCIEIADKAYYDGDLKKADRLLKKAERLYPSERAKDILEKVKTALEDKKRQESEKPKTSEADCNQAPVERKQETQFDHEVQTLLKSGIVEMQKHNYYTAKFAFEKAHEIKPCKFIDDMVKNVKSKINERNAGEDELKRTGKKTSIPKNKSESEIKGEAEMYIAWAENEFIKGQIKNAEYFLKLAEAYSTVHSRRLLVDILKAKHSHDLDSDDDDSNAFTVVLRNKKTITTKKEYTGKGYIASAEEKFISGNFKEARKLLCKSQEFKRPYVTQLKKEIEIMVNKTTDRWHDDKVYNFFNDLS